MTNFKLSAFTFVAIGFASLTVGIMGQAHKTTSSQDAGVTDRIPPGKAEEGKQERAHEKKDKRLRPATPKEYIIEPPDLIVVEVLGTLPGRPITGERLVSPDGKVSLGFYGDVSVAGLTLVEAKERIVLHLRKHINDESLGLVAGDEGGRKIPVNPRDSDRIYVDVAAYNSKYYYVQGCVKSPGRFHFTGKESVLDAINLANGLSATAGREKGFLIRKDKDDQKAQVVELNLDEILTGSDLATNLILQIGDRIVVKRDPTLTPQAIQEAVESENSKTLEELSAKAQRLEARVKTLEDKIDQVLETLKEKLP